MQFDRRAICGPILTTATAMTAILVDRYWIGVPNPAPLLVCIVAFAGSLNGLGSAAVSAAIAIAGSALFFLDHRGIPGYQIGRSRWTGDAGDDRGRNGCDHRAVAAKMMDAFALERRHYATAERLSDALDQFDIGIVLLDADTRAEFINRAFRDYFSLPDAKADAKPPFIALMYHGRDTGAYELPAEELNSFIARRMEMMRFGDSRRSISSSPTARCCAFPARRCPTADAC